MRGQYLPCGSPLKALAFHHLDGGQQWPSKCSHKAGGFHMKRVFMTVTALAALTAALNAQPNQRRAVMTGGGGPDRGQCTIEVVVDGAAEVEIRGDTATLRDLSGQAPQWRRFECSGPLPSNPANFTFRGINGRGKQDLVRDPRNGGVAVVRIEDSEGGAGGYTFNLTWNAGGGYPGGQDRGGAVDTWPGPKGRGPWPRSTWR
jgi:hypothetical protein